MKDNHNIYDILESIYNKYEIYYDIYDQNILTARIVAASKSNHISSTGKISPSRSLYFEIHADRKGSEHFLIYIPADSYVPIEVKDKFNSRVFTVPNIIKRIFNKSIYGHVLSDSAGKRPMAQLFSTVEELLRQCFVPERDSGSNSDPKENNSIGLRSAQKPKMKIKSIQGGPSIKNCEHPFSNSATFIKSIKEENSLYTLYIDDIALDTIFSHIEFGEKTSRNVVEQGGVYLGTPYSNKEHGDFCIVHAAIAVEATRGSSTYVEFTHTMWAEILEDIDRKKSQGIFKKDWVILGWYHTHPNNLDVFMSGTDMNTQRKLFYNNWNSAIVINPHRRLIRCFQGAMAEPTNIRLMEA